MTGRQLEALFLTYDDMKNQGRDLSVYQISIDIDVKNIIMNVVYSIQPNDGGSQRGGTKINPEVHYVVNVKDLKIVKITYGK